MGPVLMSYMRTVEEARAVAWEAVAGSVGAAGADGTGGSQVPRSGEKGLARG